MVYLASTSFNSMKGEVKVRAAVVSGEGDLLSYSNGNDVISKNTFSSDEPLGVEMQPDARVEMQPDAIAFGALSADTAPTSVGFPEDSDEFDLDSPTVGFASIPEAIEDIQQGKVSCHLSGESFHEL